MPKTGSRGLALCATLVALLAVAPAAQAADPSRSTVCTASTAKFEQVFNRAPWYDPGSYALSPAASMEAKMTNWTFSGSAGVVSGNESYYINSASDRRSLRLPAGTTTTSAPMCVGLEYPWMRFFHRNTGTSGTLKVEVRGVSPLGLVTTLLATTLTGKSSWQLSPQILLVDNLTAPLSTNGLTPVAFRFTASGGPWLIDDVYVDPYRSR